LELNSGVRIGVGGRKRAGERDTSVDGQKKKSETTV